MLRLKTQAFTILEVIFFIAISGLIIMVAMNSVGTRQRNVQFTDSMRSLESFIKSQLSATTAGVNDTVVGTGVDNNRCESDGGTSGTCVFLGRVIIFNEGENSNQIEYYSMLGNRMSATHEAECVVGLLSCAEPETEDFTRTYNLLWQSRFIGGKHRPQNQDSRAFAFLRSPRGSSTVPVSYQSFNDNQTLIGAINNANNYQTSENTAADTGSQVDAYYCFSSADNRSKAIITITGLQISLLMDFNESDYDC